MKTRSARRSLSGRQIVALVLAVAALLFVLQNREKTEVELLNANFDAPLWTVLLTMLGIGIIVGLLMRRKR